MKQQFNISIENKQGQRSEKLAIQIGNYHFGFVIADKETSALHSLVYYSLENVNKELVEKILDAHAELKGNFEGIRVGYDINMGISKIEETNEAENNALAPLGIIKLMNERFPQAVTHHQSSLLYLSIAPADSNRLLVDIRTKDFTVAVWQNGKIISAQNFEYATPEDVLFYLLGICQRFSLSQSEVVLVISGLIEQDSNLYKELYQYFLHIHFKEAEWQTDQIPYPAHFFTSLNDLLKCE